MEFRNGFGCYSLAGRDGGRQDIVLGPYCAEEHTLIHEVFLKIFNTSNKEILVAYAPSCGGFLMSIILDNGLFILNWSGSSPMGE